MKAIELRIGIILKGRKGKFTIISIQDIALFKLWEDTKYSRVPPFKPIPLTEEWLLKFGFKNRSTHSQNWHLDLEEGYYYRKGEPYIRLVKKIFYIYVTGESPVKINTIDYVHQLQNLYFALTDEELPIA